MPLKLTDITRELFDYIVAFRSRLARAAVPDMNTVRYELETVFHNMETKLTDHPSLMQEYRIAKYPLVALADEVILTSSWTQAKQWEQFLLERKYFSSNIAGNHFFVLLQKVEQMPLSVVTVFFYCLAFGFRGGFTQDDPSVMRLQDRLLQRIRPERENDDRILPEAYRAHHGETRRLPNVWKLGHVAAIALISLFVIVLIERVVVWPLLIGWSADDLSTPAAAVEPKPIGTNPVSPPGAAETVENPEYTVQLGFFRSEALASHFATQMESRGVKTKVVVRKGASGTRDYLVLNGSFSTKEAALAQQQRAEALTPLVTEMRVLEKSAAKGDCLSGCL